MGFSTDAIHAGQNPDPTTGAVITPLYLTSTYAQEGINKHKGYEYGRTQNLTRAALENNVAALEKGRYGIAFSSGLAATQALLSLVKSGDHVLVSDNVYGGTYRLFESIYRDYGIDFSWINTRSIDDLKNAVQENTKIIFFETPTNPMMNLTDIKLISDFARENNILTIVDNTFMSPYFQNPLTHGADIVLHSSTKYLNGHSDVIGGIVITNNEKVSERLKYIQNAAGSVPSPFDCWLTLRATKTLAVRMKQHNENAIAVANFLKDQNYIKKIYYAGLDTHPQHDLAKKQMSGFGGMISVDFGDVEFAHKVAGRFKVFTLAESLGGVESLVCYPAEMTHASVPKERREAMGLTDSLIRFSVGIEDVEDLIKDIEQAVRL